MSSESSSSSSSESSAPSSPVAPKTSQSSSGTPETSKKASESTLEVYEESDNYGPSERVSHSLPSSPEASEKVLNSPTKEHKESNTPEPPDKFSKSSASSPKYLKRDLKSPIKEPKDSNSSESLKVLSQSPLISSETPEKILKSPTAESKPPDSHEKPEKVLAPPKGPTEVQEVSTSPVDAVPPSKGRSLGNSFKSSLQVLLQRQEDELEKNADYKKSERNELDEQENEGEEREEDEQGKRDSEENTVEEKAKGKIKDAGKREAKGEEAKYKSKKMKQKEAENTREKSVDKENNKEKGKQKNSEKITEEKHEESKSGKESKRTEKGEGKCGEEQAKITDKGKGERKKKEGEKLTERGEKVKVEEQDNKMEERRKKGEIKKTGKEERSEGTTKKEKMQKDEKKIESRKEVIMEEKTKINEEQMKMKKEEEEEEEKKKRQEEPREGEPRKKQKQKSEEMDESSKMKKGVKEEKVHGSLYMKRKRTFNPWKEYYFVLDGLLLTYYRSQQQYDHLSGMKGSLDLSLVEGVHPRKPGLMKTHHPFCLARRNLPSIRLAAATKTEQQKWVDVLRAAIRPHRLSSHSSDKTLHTASASATDISDPASECKAATLPARIKNISSCSSSVTEEDEEEDEEEEIKEEEPELIQPKKVMRVPVGLPLAIMNLGEVKLKKLEKREVKREEDSEMNTAAAAHNTTEGDARETSPGELFGVVLKKTMRQEEKKEKEEKEILRDTTTTPIRRPSKQPVIPLNSGKLLVVPEVKSPKTSPATQKRQTPERRKSPSPSLPISKSVQALTKSAEEVKAKQVDITSSEPLSSTSTTTLTSAATGKAKVAGVKLCHAQTSEVKYSKVEAMDEEEKVMEVQAARREDVEIDKKDVTKKEKDMEDVKAAKTTEVESEKKDVMGKEDELQEAVNDAQEGKKTKEVDTLVVGVEQRPRDKEDGMELPLDPLINIKDEDDVCVNLKESEEVQETEEKLDKELQEVEDEKVVSEEDVGEGPWEACRDRANTNESITSFSTEDGGKKPGKLQFLKKLKSGASHKEKKEEPSSPKDPRKRRGSNAFSVLLAGKKKNGGKKHAEEEPQPHVSQEEAKNEPPTAPQHAVIAAPHHTVTASSEPPAAEVSLSPGHRLPRVDLQEVDPASPQPVEDSLLAQMDRSSGRHPSTEDTVAPRVTSSPSNEAYHNTHSLYPVGSCDNQPPSIPEKTFMRAHSPSYDVPKSNRPVTRLHLMDMDDEDEDEDENEAGQTVDGYITEEQIEALLNAKENRKWKRSKSRTQLLVVPDVVKGASLPAAAPHSSVEDCGLERPSFNSFSSIDSDESLPVTNFLGVQRCSSSSGSLKGCRRSLEADGDEHTVLPASESRESLTTETEAPAESQRRAPRPTDAITANNRLSLTSPEFTVQEEEGLSSPEIAKTRPSCQGENDGKRERKNADETKAKVEAGTKAEADAEAEAESEAEQEDFFPVVGRDVQLRQPTAHLAGTLDLPKDDLRMSGIVSLKEYLRTQEEEKDLERVKSGISRLGHSAAVEKLKQTSSEQ